MRSVEQNKWISLSPSYARTFAAITLGSEQIPVTVEASGRATGTDADAVHLSRSGVPTGLVLIPVRYMHSPVELVQLDDVDACARLIAAVALALEDDASFTR